MADKPILKTDRIKGTNGARSLVIHEAPNDREVPGKGIAQFVDPAEPGVVKKALSPLGARDKVKSSSADPFVTKRWVLFWEQISLHPLCASGQRDWRS